MQMQITRNAHIICANSHAIFFLYIQDGEKSTKIVLFYFFLLFVVEYIKIHIKMCAEK